MCCRAIHCNLIISFIGMILSFSAFICFAFVFHNYAAGVLAFYSGILSMITFHLHRLKSKGVLRDWYSFEIFNNIQLFGLFGLLFGMAMTVWYIFEQINYDCPIMPIDTSVAIRMVWSFMTFKWGLLLFLFCRKYSLMLDELHVVLSDSVSD